MSVPLTSAAPVGWTTPEKIAGIAITVLTLAVSAATSVATSQSQLAGKIDRTEFETRFVRESTARAVSEERQRRIEIGVDSANLRLRQIICNGQPASCR